MSSASCNTSSAPPGEAAVENDQGECLLRVEIAGVGAVGDERWNINDLHAGVREARLIEVGGNEVVTSCLMSSPWPV